MDPMTWIMLALMAAGTAAQYKGQKKVDKERGKALAEESTRRQKLQAQSEASARNTEEAFAKAKAAETAKAAELEAQYQKPAEAPIETGTPGEYQVYGANTAPTGSTETIRDAQNAAVKRKTYFDTMAKLKGQLGAFGGVMQDLNPQTMRNAQDIGLNSQSMINWNQNVLPIQMEAANQSGRDWSTAGDIMKAASAIMAPWALAQSGAAQAGQAAATGAAAGAAGGVASGAGAGLGGAAARALGSVAAPAAGGAANAGLGAGLMSAFGYAQNPAQIAAMKKLWMGLPLSQAERVLVNANF